MALTQFAINDAKPKDKSYLLSDCDGLAFIQAAAAIALPGRGEPNTMSLGAYSRRLLAPNE